MPGAFICQVSDTDWIECRSKGAYGNRENKPDSSVPLRPQDRLSVIRDLISVRPGDILFFHTIGRDLGPSGLRGPYRARSIPFYDRSPIWDSDLEIYPFRFLFEPLPEYEPICRADLSIRIADIYAAIEAREIWSLATLENERNIERRAVRKISIDDARVIINILLREFKEGSRPSDVQPSEIVSEPAPIVPIRSHVTEVGRYENAIKALVMDKLANRDAICEQLFPQYFDFMNETFVAPTTRKLIDILVVSQVNAGSRHYYIIEAKTGGFEFENLRQLLSYIDLLRRRPIFKPNEDQISACALATGFDWDTIRFRALRANLSIFDPIKLIKYQPRNGNRDTDLIEVPIPPEFEAIEWYSQPLAWDTDSPLQYILANISATLPFYSNDRYVTHQLVRQLDNISLLIEERSNMDNNIMSIYLVYVSETLFSATNFHDFLNKLYLEVAPLVDFNFRAINAVIISREYESQVLDYTAMLNKLSVRRPIHLYRY